MSLKTAASDRASARSAEEPVANEKRLAVVTDNPMLAGAIRAGLGEGGTLRLVGYLDPRTVTGPRIKGSGADVVLIDEHDEPDRAIELIPLVREGNDGIRVVLLTMRMDGAGLDRALAAGADIVIRKAIHPGALSTFLEEALKGHIVHSRAGAASPAAKSEQPDEHSTLTARELAILRLVASGATNDEIAQKLWITRQTVKFHVSNIYRKLSVSNRTGACHYAHVSGVMAAEHDDAVGIAV